MIKTMNQIQALFVSTYSGEPCRICGKNLTTDDILNGAVYAGYSANDESRGAHKECWEAGVDKNKWAYPEGSND